MAKSIRIAPKDTTTWATLPGSTGEFSQEAESLDDTIFGQSFMSKQPDIIKWSVNANAFYKGFSGYQAKIYSTASASASAFTDEATTNVSGKIYQITDTSKRLWDLDTTVVVEDDASPVAAADIDYIDYLSGTVEFDSGYTVTGAVTVTGASLAPSQICTMNQFTLTQTMDAIDQTNMCNVQSNGGYREYIAGLKTVALDLSGFFSSSAAFLDELAARGVAIIEIGPDGSSKSYCRGFFKPMTHGQSGKVGALEEETLKYELFVPDTALLQAPFQWYHASDTTLNTAIQTLMSAWEGDTLVEAQYLYDGTNGWTGEAVPTDISLKGGIGNLNEFTCNLQGSGALSAVP